MVTQEDFVESCKSKYVWERIPEGEIWHDAHYPTPECKGGLETIPLWESDHAAHNVIQSEELGHPCIFGWEIKYLTGDYEYLIPAFNRWLRELRSIAGKSGGLKQPRTVKQENGRKLNQKMLERMSSEDIFLRAQRGGQNGGQVTGRIRVQCPTCGIISTPGPLGIHLKSKSNDCSGNPLRLI